MLIIKDIVVGERRRQDLGDLTALAKSIQRYGLIQPIVVDAAMNLVAGERRLRAAQALGWERIEVRQLGDLSMQELRLLELEENIRRKDLTSYEQSKAMTVYAGAVTEELEEAGLMGDSPKNLQGGRPKKAASQEKVAERVGTSRRTICEAQSHVETADAFPFMQSWPQYRVLEAREQAAGIPLGEHPRVAMLLDQPGIPPIEGVSIIRNLATKPQEEREGIYALNESGDSYQRLSRSGAGGLSTPAQALSSGNTCLYRCNAPPSDPRPTPLHPRPFGTGPVAPWPPALFVAAGLDKAFCPWLGALPPVSGLRPVHLVDTTGATAERCGRMLR